MESAHCSFHRRLTVELLKLTVAAVAMPFKAFSLSKVGSCVSESLGLNCSTISNHNGDPSSTTLSDILL